MSTQPDPSMIGGVPKAPLAFLPDPVAIFQKRADRFAFLANESPLAPYLAFLADLSRLQGRLASDLTAPAPIPADRIAMTRAARMPPIDRGALADDPVLGATLTHLCNGAADLEMPGPARQALDAVTAANAEERRWMLANVLADHIPADSIAPHLFAATAAQVHLAKLAATLDAGQLVPIRTGVCPVCGGLPASSMVTGAMGIENARYATCSGCATNWNEVRVKCLCCAQNGKISYRSVEIDGTDRHDAATVKAEVCGDCNSWVKILYQVHNASLDPIADDVGSLGLDLLMQATPYRRGGFNPFTVGH